MQRNLTALTRRLTKLEVKRAAAASELPAWCARGSQGAAMIWAELTMLEYRVSQASDPDWFVGDEVPAQVAEEIERVGIAMVLSGSYGAAQAIAITEQDKYPPIDYRRWRRATEPETTETAS